MTYLTLILVHVYDTFIHSLKNLYSASSSPLLLRGAPDSSTVEKSRTHHYCQNVFWYLLLEGKTFHRCLYNERRRFEVFEIYLSAFLILIQYGLEVDGRPLKSRYFDVHGKILHAQSYSTVLSKPDFCNLQSTYTHERRLREGLGNGPPKFEVGDGPCSRPPIFGKV